MRGFYKTTDTTRFSRSEGGKSHSANCLLYFCKLNFLRCVTTDLGIELPSDQHLPPLPWHAAVSSGTQQTSWGWEAKFTALI